MARVRFNFLSWKSVLEKGEAKRENERLDMNGLPLSGNEIEKYVPYFVKSQPGGRGNLCFCQCYFVKVSLLLFYWLSCFCLFFFFACDRSQ